MRLMFFIACCFLLPVELRARAPDTTQALAAIKEHAVASQSDSVLIQQHGNTLLAAGASTGDRPVPLMSATKSVVALAIMLLVEDRLLTSIDQPVHTVYPEWRQGRKRDITVRMVLDHTSGLQNTPNAGVELEGAPDLIKLALAAELAAEPGTTFAYNNKATNLLTGMVERLSGQPVDVYLQTRLFAPLGITHYTWMKDAAGTPMGMAGLAMSAGDLASIGQLLLDNGLAPDGRRVLGADSVALLLAESRRSPEVGLLWWRIPAWERYTLKAEAGDALAANGVAAGVRTAVLASGGRTFDNRTALTAFLAQQLGPTWAEQYGTEITSRDLRLADMFVSEKGQVRAYSANGYLGQYLVVVPDKGLVAVRQIHRRDTHQNPRDDYAAFPADVLRLADTL